MIGRGAIGPPFSLSSLNVRSEEVSGHTEWWTYEYVHDSGTRRQNVRKHQRGGSKPTPLELWAYLQEFIEVLDPKTTLSNCSAASVQVSWSVISKGSCLEEKVLGQLQQQISLQGTENSSSWGQMQQGWICSWFWESQENKEKEPLRLSALHYKYTHGCSSFLCFSWWSDYITLFT